MSDYNYGIIVFKINDKSNTQLGYYSYNQDEYNELNIELQDLFNKCIKPLDMSQDLNNINVDILNTFKCEITATDNASAIPPENNNNETGVDPSSSLSIIEDIKIETN